ncbi:MAG: DUF924 family protein [Burkholderiaceae bacterium]
MTPTDILRFCFAQGIDSDLDRHLAFWAWMMRGGADAQIIARFSSLTAQAAAGKCDSWAESARGRLALILVLDQFSRSVYRGTGAAYAQDPAALALVECGLGNGHFDSLRSPWERTMFALPLVHTEGPTIRERAALNVQLAQDTLSMAQESLKPAYEFCLAQSRRHQAVIDRFGRHPHRNAVLRRASTADESLYLEAGAFPHEHEIGKG